MGPVEHERVSLEASSPEEHLDWMAIQSELLNEQNRLLHDIRRHTGLVFAACVIWLSVVGLGLLVFLIALVVAASR